VRLLVICWLASWTWSALLGDVVSMEPLLLAFASGLLAVVLVEIAPAPAHVAAAMVAGGREWRSSRWGRRWGVDPFALAGWMAPIAGASARLRVYGTLGNPNFVAALLVATAPLTVSLLATRGRATATVPLSAALVLQIAGVIVTGSRAGALGLFVAAMTWAAVGRGWRTPSASASRSSDARSRFSPP